MESVYAPLGWPIAVYGHVHRSFGRRTGTAQVINTGSVSLSYDGDPGRVCASSVLPSTPRHPRSRTRSAISASSEPPFTRSPPCRIKSGEVWRRSAGTASNAVTLPWMSLTIATRKARFSTDQARYGVRGSGSQAPDDRRTNAAQQGRGARELSFDVAEDGQRHDSRAHRVFKRHGRLR